MTTYTTLSDTTLSSGKPGTQSVGRALRDNALAIAERDVSAPQVKGAKLDHLGDFAPAAATQISINNTIFTGAYEEYWILLRKLIPATNNVSLLIQTSTDNGSTVDSGAANYDWVLTGRNTTPTDLSTQSAADTSITLLQAAANSTGINLLVRLFDLASTAIYKGIHWSGGYTYNGGLAASVHGYGRRLATADIDYARILFNSGNITSGVAVVYGVYYN
jgi:hypothetical protein